MKELDLCPLDAPLYTCAALASFSTWLGWRYSVGKVLNIERTMR